MSNNRKLTDEELSIVLSFGAEFDWEIYNPCYWAKLALFKPMTCKDADGDPQCSDVCDPEGLLYQLERFVRVR